MKFLFQNDTEFNKLFIASDTWMCLMFGEGEKEIANQGRSVNGFSQETEAIGRSQPWNGEEELRLKTDKTKSQVQDAQATRTQLPIFFFSKKNQRLKSKTEFLLSYA